MRFKGVALKSGEFVYGDSFLEVPLKLVYSLKYELELLEKYDVTQVALLTNSKTNKSYYVDMKTLQERVKTVTEYGSETVIYTNDLIYNIKTGKTFSVLYNYNKGRAEVKDLTSGEVISLHHLTNKTTVTDDISDLLVLDARPVGNYVKSTSFTSTKLFKYKDKVCDSFDYSNYEGELVLKLYKDGNTIDTVKDIKYDSIKPLVLIMDIDGNSENLFDCDVVMVKLHDNHEVYIPFMLKYNSYSGGVHLENTMGEMDFHHDRMLYTLEQLKDKPKKLKQPIN